MKKEGEIFQDTLATLNDRTVAEYLLRHPDFFIRNASDIERMRIPHPIRRGTVSLVEWYMSRARSYIQQLEEKIAILMGEASNNETLFYHLLHLQENLVSVHSLQEFLRCFCNWANELGLSGATIRLFPDRWRISNSIDSSSPLPLSRQAFEPMRLRRLGTAYHYLGPLSGQELLLLLPELKSIGSVAMSLMGHHGDLGVILFTSRDSHHYEKGQGTQLLQKIALMLPNLLERWVERI